MINEKKKGPCWKGYEAVGMKMKGGRKVPNCVPVKESVDKIVALLNEKVISGGNGILGTVEKMKRARKAQGKKAAKHIAMARAAAKGKKVPNLPSEVGFHEGQAAKARKAGRKAKELHTRAVGAEQYKRKIPVEDSIQRIGYLLFEYNKPLDEGRIRDFLGRLKANLKDPHTRRKMLGKALTAGLALTGGYQRYVAPYGQPDAKRSALDSSVPETSTEKGMRNIMGDRYKDNWIVQQGRKLRNRLGTRNKDQDLVWGAYDLVTPGNRQQKLHNRYGKSYPNRSVINPYQKGYDPYANESIQRIGQVIAEVAAWQRKEGKNPSGGLNKKGVESYRKENPGSKLKTAVTTKPSKLKKGSKAAKRRKSFCARMGGMKRRLTSKKTASNPDSRINKALRKWNC